MRMFLQIVFLSVLNATAHAAPTMAQILDATDDVTRGASSHATIQMQVKTARYERTMKLETWSEGKDKSLVRILAPAKDAGIATLMLDENIYNYLPKVDRTMKVPGAMMSGRWMGSHFTNDDLIKSSRLAEEFDGTITTKPGDGTGDVYTVELIPKPDTAVVWGKVVVVTTADLMPQHIQYFDEEGILVRTMRFSDVQELGGRRVPATMSLEPANKPGEFTRIVYDQLEFDVAIDERTFSLQSLKR